MEQRQTAGILSIILGLIFLIFPVFSTAMVTILIGISLIFFGLAILLTGFSAFNIVVGILAVILGLVFVFNIEALSVVFALQFYIIGILMILAGIASLLSEGSSKIISILIIILGIISFALGGFSIDNPIFAAALIGVGLIIEGIGLYIE